MGSIFAKKIVEVKMASKENNTIDTVVDKLDDVQNELELTRKGHEAATWGEEVADMEDVELEDING